MSSRWRTVLGKLGTLSVADWHALARAQLALIRAQLLVATRPTGRLVSGAPAVEAAPDGLIAEPPEPPEPPDPRAGRLALAVSRAGDYGLFRPLCLVRAVALQRLLEAHGMRGSRIRIGVRRRRGRFAAHAWVEYRGSVLGDLPEHVETFVEMADVRLLPRA